MKRVRIIRGVYGHKPYGTGRVRPVGIGDTVDVPDEEAERLVFLGVAEMVPETPSNVYEDVATLQDGQTDGEPGMGVDAEVLCGESDAEGRAASAIDPEQLKTMTNAKLRELAEAMGIHTAKLKNKAELIDAITSAQVIPGNEEETVEDGEQPPDLCAEAPVI
ncbi:MAG: Rho termination factor N-terminal domain-containing protein [Faecousia sp.]